MGIRPSRANWLQCKTIPQSVLGDFYFAFDSAIGAQARLSATSSWPYNAIRRCALETAIVERKYRCPLAAKNALVLTGLATCRVVGN